MNCQIQIVIVAFIVMKATITIWISQWDQNQLCSTVYKEGDLLKAMNKRVLVAPSELACIFFTIQTILHDIVWYDT